MPVTTFEDRRARGWCGGPRIDTDKLSRTLRVLAEANLGCGAGSDLPHIQEYPKVGFDLVRSVQHRKASMLKNQLTIVCAHNYYQSWGGEDAVFESNAKLLEDRGHRIHRYAVRNDRITTMSRW